MIKICILGNSGSGKSTLADTLSNYYQINCLHLDEIAFFPNWIKKSNQEIENDVIKNLKQDWIIDGNYLNIYPQRFQEASQLIFLDYNRLFCFFSCFKRYFKFKNKIRPTAPKGCLEKFDWEFAKWILFGYPKKNKKRIKRLVKENYQKSLIFKNRRKLNKYLKKNNIRRIENE